VRTHGRQVPALTYSPQTWSNTPGETPINAQRLGHMEDGIEDASLRLDVVEPALSDLQDDVSALQGALGGGNSFTLPGGPAASRPAPLAHAVWVDDDLDYPIWGDGTAWHKFTDNTVVTGSGGANAPRGFSITINPSNSVTASWTAPPSVTVTTYKLYESRSTSGVSGQTAISGSATSLTYTPSFTGTGDWWLTATVSGVEGAASNHAGGSLPYSGSTFSGSPAQLLNFGTTGGFWSLDIGYDTGDVSYSYSQLAGGYTNFPYFCLNSGSTAVQFYVDMAGKTTSSGTHYARSELRELKSDGVTHAAWTASGSSTHVMQYTFKISHLQPLKPWVTIGQIHDASSDALSIKIKGSSTSALSIVATIYDTDQSTLLASSYTIGSTVTIRIEITNGTTKLYCNGVLKITTTAFSGKTGLYFKCGVYPQSHDDWGGFESPTEYCQADISGLTVSHSPAI